MPPTQLHECRNCYVEFEPTPAQVVQLRQGKNTYCCVACKSAYKSTTVSRASTPWAWLGCKTTLNNLPTEEPEEIWTGY